MCLAAGKRNTLYGDSAGPGGPVRTCQSSEVHLEQLVSVCWITDSLTRTHPQIPSSSPHLHPVFIQVKFYFHQWLVFRLPLPSFISTARPLPRFRPRAALVWAKMVAQMVPSGPLGLPPTLPTLVLRPSWMRDKGYHTFVLSCRARCPGWGTPQSFLASGTGTLGPWDHSTATPPHLLMCRS